MKGVLLSKTIWFNLLTLLASLLAMPEIVHVIGAEAAVMIVSAVNVLLRLVTTTAVSVSSPTKGA